MAGQTLTALEVLGAAHHLLTSSGYRPAPADDLWPAQPGMVRTYEDEYSVVAILVFDTVRALETAWPDAQATVVSFMTRFMSRDEAKAWDGYLVLLTPQMSDPAEAERLDAIRYDTSRLRKIVAAGERLRRLSDVERALLPLLPIDADIPDQPPGSAIDLLPDLLKRQDVADSVTKRVVGAFESQTSIMKVLHEVVQEK